MSNPVMPGFGGGGSSGGSSAPKLSLGQQIQNVSGLTGVSSGQVASGLGHIAGRAHFVAPGADLDAMIEWDEDSAADVARAFRRHRRGRRS